MDRRLRSFQPKELRRAPDVQRSLLPHVAGAMRFERSQQTLPRCNTAVGRGFHAENCCRLRSHRRGERLRGAGARHRACCARPRRHQSRHRPARLPHARFHRRGRGQGASRWSPWLYAGSWNCAAARSRGRRSASAFPGHRVARRSDDPARRQAHHVHVDLDVRRARRRHPLSRSGLSHLSLHDRIYRRAPDPGADPRGERLCFLRRRDLGADHAANAFADREFTGQPHRRGDPEARDRQARCRAGEISRRRGDVGRDLRPHGL